MGAPVVNAHPNAGRFLKFYLCHCPERGGAVGGSMQIFIVNLATGSHSAVKLITIPAGQAFFPVDDLILSAKTLKKHRSWREDLLFPQSS